MNTTTALMLTLHNGDEIRIEAYEWKGARNPETRFDIFVNDNIKYQNVDEIHVLGYMAKFISQELKLLTGSEDL